MAQFYEMPSVSPTMERGTLVSWRLREGDRFEPQTIVAEVGTDKANVEVEMFDSGVLIKRLVEEGEEVPPGFPIAIVGGSADEDVSELLRVFEGKKAALGAKGAPAAAPEKAAPPSTPAVQRAVTGREWMGKKLPADFMEPPGDLGLGAAPARVLASPLARKVAEAKGILLANVVGSGPGGRILRADVEGARTTRALQAAVADESIRLTPMRKAIARRLTASHQEIPTFFLTIALDASELVRFRAALKEHLPDAPISFNDLLLACVARAIREFPAVNAKWGETEITRLGRIDLGMAVAVPDGLITPVLRDADRLSISEIAARTRELASRAKEGKLQEQEYTGSTFTVSNLGMFGIEHFTAIINPPEAAILAVAAIHETPVVVDGALTVGKRLHCTLTCDHRVIDGATGAKFLQVLRKFAETPALLLV